MTTRFWTRSLRPAGGPRSCTPARARRGLPVVGIDDRAAATAIGRLAFAGAARPVVLSFPINRDRAQALLTGPPGPAVTYPVTRRRWDGLLDAWRQDGGSRGGQLRVAVCPANSASPRRSIRRGKALPRR